MSVSADERVVIVGYAGLFPGAEDADRFRHNVLNGVDASRELPRERCILPQERVFDPQTTPQPDKVYSLRGYYIDHIPHDPTLPPGLDPLFHLAVHLGRSAYASARMTNVDPKRVGVCIGNIALPTDQVSHLARHILADRLGDRLPPNWTTEPPPHTLNRFVAGLPAGLIAQALGLGGGTCTFDAACASSLYALKPAIDALRSGRLDAVLAGGMSRPDCLYTQMGFAQLRALATGGICAPFDERGSGLMVGEGGGVFVLKRLTDALSHGDTIHAVIAGIGLSNDRAGNLLAPAKEGQLRAMQAAYRSADWAPTDVQLIECHATGTPIGDAVEFESLSTLWGNSGRVGRTVLGSVKSTTGHLLTGAGAAGLMKVLFALRDGLLPPTANFRTPGPNIRLAGSPFRILTHAEAWPKTDGPRRAAISGFGFGGINAHVLLEEFQDRRSGTRVAPIGKSPEETKPTPCTRLAIVGVGVRCGSLDGVAAYRELVLNGRTLTERTIDPVRLPLHRFRIPPTELREVLPQQLLMLDVADAALRDVVSSSEPDDGLTTGCYLGLGLDLNTTNFHLRWALLAAGEPAVADAVSPPLSADRTMGHLGSITASRIAREYRFGGPSFSICAEENSFAAALNPAMTALQHGAIRRALVGAIDFAADPRAAAEAGCDAAVCFVLKTLDDALAAQDRIYAVLPAEEIDEKTVGFRDGDEAFDTLRLVGNAGFASAGLRTLTTVLALYENILPGSEPSFWLHDRESGPRRGVARTISSDGNRSAIVVEEGPMPSETTHPLGDLSEALFVVSGATIGSLSADLDALAHAANSATDVHALAKERATRPIGLQRAALVAGSLADLRAQIAFLRTHLRERPNERLPDPSRTGPNPALRDRLFWRPEPLGSACRIAFVYPGSGNHFYGMGRELGAHFPQVLRRQMRENEALRRQYAADLLWYGSPDMRVSERELIFSQVSVGTLVSDLLRSLHIQPSAAIGNSLGESASLFGLRAWTSRDEMLRRLETSSLFVSDLAGRFESARRFFGTPDDQPIEWFCGTVPVPPEAVRSALDPTEPAYLLIVNTPRECVIGGVRSAVERLAARLNAPILPLTGITLAHCRAAEPIAELYRALHTLPTEPPSGVVWYSGSRTESYSVTESSAADAITNSVLHTIDFPRTIENAYRDGVRCFLEIGPGASCTRMIETILEGKPFVARAVCVARQDNISLLLRLLGELSAEHIWDDLAAFYPPSKAEPIRSTEPSLAVPVKWRRPLDLPRKPTPTLSTPRTEAVVPRSSDYLLPAISALTDTHAALAEAHSAFLRFSTESLNNLSRTYALQTHYLTTLIGSAQRDDISNKEPLPPARPRGVPRSLTFEECCTFAVGKIGDVLGPEFAAVDAFPTRVRLPEGPLQLVDRILLIEGEPRSLGSGRVVTEHDVRADRWYLDAGRIPTAVVVEAGQADLFLSGFLGIDFVTQGRAVYRLLDAVVTFHRPLPKVGETIHYDIHIDHFFRQGDTHLFRFRFESTVNGEPMLSMTNGVAGFFTEEELAAGKGIIHTELDRRPQPGILPPDWQPFVPIEACSLAREQVDALRRGDLVGAFGLDFARANLRRPQKLPGGMLRLVDRVVEIDPLGGHFGLGRICAEYDIDPNDWFLRCHFVDDQVMPGTLMYECCLHTLRILLMRLGWLGEEDEVHCEPKPGIASRLKCRGQVIGSTRTVTYEITLKELGFEPNAFALADALMYADGKPIVEITNMSIRLSGLTREKLTAVWNTPAKVEPRYDRRPALYDTTRITAFAIGKPSEAFGDRYRIFDSERTIARLPGPPFQFLDRITAIDGEPWVMKAGPTIEAQYDVPADAWYFAANRCRRMPFAVLLETALQPCGWLAAYVGSALTSDKDLSFRNLGGEAIQHHAVGPSIGTLTTKVTLTRVSSSGGMIIQHYDYAMIANATPIYTGNTYFGFFSKEALAEQIGIRDNRWCPEGDEAASISSIYELLPTHAPFPDSTLRMIDRVDVWNPHGGSVGLGFIQGRISVDPQAWFFKAHFFQDPVWPGSLGLESFLQLLKYASFRLWGEPLHGWQAVNLNSPHRWSYRGQVLPTDQEVTVQAEITARDDTNRLLTARGYLRVDGRVIYEMHDFTIAPGATDS